MAEEVSASLETGEALLLEAGTGVGKTLAYLVPLLTKVQHGEQRAVVSTHTKALQSQILEQDLPRLKPLLGQKQFNLLMGARQLPLPAATPGLFPAAGRRLRSGSGRGLFPALAGRHPGRAT